MNPDGTIGKNPRTTEEIMAYNRAAAEATEESGVPVNDLFAVTKNWPSSCYRDYCHYTQEYAAVLGRHVAQFIRAKL